MQRSYEYNILCIDDDQAFLQSMKMFMTGKFDEDVVYSYNLLFMDSPIKALELIDEMRCDNEEIAMVIIDQMMPEMKGIDFLRKLKSVSPDTMNVLLTGYAGMDSAVLAINEKILDKYLAKPIEDKNDMLMTFKHLLNEFHLKKMVDYQQKFLVDLYAFSNSLNNLTTISTTLNYVIDFIKETLHCERISILLLEKDILTIKASLGIPDSVVQSINIPLGTSVSGMVLADQKAVLVTDINEIPWLADKINPDYKSFISIPLIYAGLNSPDKPLGVINATNKINNQPFDEFDLKAFSFIANTSSIAINNQINHYLLEETYYTTITSLSSALEAKDPYTNGHSHRVMEYCVGIADFLNLGRQRTEILKKAAILHDIGKIGIKDDILLKPGKLTAEEYAKIKEHPLISETIINPISFLKDVSLIVRHHHEKIDGSGYPDGITSKEIPMEAKIMAVADAYDAMTSSRAYRNARDIETVIKELERCAGTQFDKECVSAFVDYLRSKPKTSE